MYLVTIHTPYSEWHTLPEVELFTTFLKAEEYKAKLEVKQPKGSACFISITKLTPQ
jgi:hypothetical protein